MFWENFVELCSQNETSPNAVAAELGKSSGSVTAWKNGAVPRETTLKKIAEHFSVTVDRLLYGQKEKPATEIGSGHSEIDFIFSQLTPANQTKLLELARLYLDHQRKTGESL